VSLLGLTTAGKLSAQAAPPPAQVMAARPLGATAATSTVTFKAINGVRVLSDGRVLVNDATARQITLLDPALTQATLVVDSSGGRVNSYGTGSGGLIPHLADSTLFVDRTAGVFVVIDPQGRMARVTPLPGRSSYLYLTSSISMYGFPAVSRGLGLVYESPISGLARRLPPGEPDRVELVGDTSALVSYDLITHRLDTLTRFSNGRGALQVLSATPTPLVRPPISSMQFRVNDSWALMADGSVAILHGVDLRIDWINANGTRSATRPFAHEWKRITDDEKVRMADSVNQTYRRMDETRVTMYIRDSTAVANGTADSATIARMKAPATVVRPLPPIGRGDGPPVPPPPAPRPTMRQRPTPMVRDTLLPSHIPDYFPAVEAVSLTGSVRADADNNLWVLIKTPVRTPDPIYDIVNRQGVLVDRVIVLRGKDVVGFAPGGFVYLASTDGPGGMTMLSGGNAAVRLERVQWKK
jgi:hypothetical protein